MTITFCYWDARGLAEPSRYILRYTETDWTNLELELTQERREQWMSEKHSLGFDMPNLPYLIDGDIKITQSLAIVRYLGRKFGLVPGENEKDIIRCDMAEQEIVDLRTAFGRLCYDPAFDEKKAAYLENLDKKLAVFDKFVGEGPFIMGEKMTYVDFMVFEYIDQITKLAPGNIANAENVTKFLENFRKLPTLQKYFESEEYKKGKYINGPRSKFLGNSVMLRKLLSTICFSRAVDSRLLI